MPQDTYYDSEYLDEIGEKVNLLDYAESQGFEFESHGREHYTNCPLHVDKTPSLSITEDADGNCTKFFCHSCKTGGGIIKWLITFEHLTFNDAVIKSSELAGMKVRKGCSSPVVRYLRSKNLNIKKSVIKTVSHEILSEDKFTKYSKEPIPEWESEGIQKDIINKFDIRIDNAMNRIVYPVRDINGNLINVKGRTRYPNYKALRVPKYLNYYKIGDMDYFQSLDLALPYVREAGEIIICESIKSTMKCWGWGIKNVCSAETHGMTDYQLKLLLRLQCDVVIAFDNDVNFYSKENIKLRKQLNKLKCLTNVYYIIDNVGYLGEKDSPMDCGEQVYRELYARRKRW